MAASSASRPFALAAARECLSPISDLGALTRYGIPFLSQKLKSAVDLNVT